MGEWMYRFAFFFTSALVGGEWSASRPGCFTPGERAPGTHRIGGWVALRAGLDEVKKRKFLIVPEFELRSFGRPVCSQSVSLLLSRNMWCPIKEYEGRTVNDVADRRHKISNSQIYTVQQDAEI
jgi:hypothetical protein